MSTSDLEGLGDVQAGAGCRPKSALVAPGPPKPTLSRSHSDNDFGRCSAPAGPSAACGQTTGLGPVAPEAMTSLKATFWFRPDFGRGVLGHLHSLSTRSRSKSSAIASHIDNLQPNCIRCYSRAGAWSRDLADCHVAAAGRTRTMTKIPRLRQGRSYRSPRVGAWSLSFCRGFAVFGRLSWAPSRLSYPPALF